MTELQVVLDFETYYDQNCSLKKLAVEEYLYHPDFHILGCAVIIISRDLGNRKFWLEPEELAEVFAAIPWDVTELVGHNLQFDGAILAWLFRHYPAVYADTMALGQRFVAPFTGSAGLAACAQYLKLGAKGDTVKALKGVTLAELRANPILHRETKSYALHDADLALSIRSRFWDGLPWHEQALIDWAVRNGITSKLELNTPLIEVHRAEIMQHRDAALAATGITDPKLFRSPKAFAAHLDSLGVEVDYKPGKNDDVLIPAIAKDDEFMQGLLRDPDDKIRFAAEARLAWASTLEITRSERLLRHAEATGGSLFIMLRYWAAHTGRFGGTNRMNMQNLGKRSALRRAIRAPRGYRIVSTDASQIECRLCAWIAGCITLLRTFANHGDPYCEFASALYRWTVTKENKIERQVGKVSVLQLGYGSGARKLMKKLELSGIVITIEEAYAIVNSYRSDQYPEIEAAWSYLERMLSVAVRTPGVAQHGRLGLIFECRVTMIDGELAPVGYITLPTGTQLIYPRLHVNHDGELCYWSFRYRNWQTLWGGKIMENICQTLARDIISKVHAMFSHTVVLQVHDELVQVVAEEFAESYLHATISAMSTTPATLPGLPLHAEGYINDCYTNPN